MNSNLYSPSRALFMALALLFCSKAAFAGSYVGKFTLQFWAESVYIAPVGDEQRSDVPACATRPLLRLQESPDTPAYRVKVAALLAAWYAGRAVSLLGTGNCTSEGDEIIFVITPQ